MIEFIESPNQSMRKGPKIDMIVIHSTASADFDSALSWMQNPKSQVSAHYLVGKDGRVVSLVKESKKAWHAGKSEWKGELDCNNFSIGIELVNKNDGKDEYPEIQIITLAGLIANIQNFYKAITDDRIVGHDQIAPTRKTDPGLLFPWVKLGAYLEEARNKMSLK